MPLLTKWLNKKVKAILLFPFAFSALLLPAQQPPLTLEKAILLAQQNYPLIRQNDLLKQTEKLSIENLRSGFLPQLNVNSQATYQSDVTKVDIPLPGLHLPVQSKDQYKAVAEASELLYDGGLTKSQQAIQALNTVVEQNKVAVELYNLKTRVNQLYFSIVYQDELLRQANLLQKDVQVGIDKVKPQVENGLVLRSNLLLLQAQWLQTKQRAVEIAATRKGLLQALSVLLNQPVDESTGFQLPGAPVFSDTITARPEVRLYQSQAQLLAGQTKLIQARNLPRASAFVQGGYGRPGLNLLSNEFKPFYITGLRLNWSLGGLYNAKRDRQLVDINRQTVDLQKDVFLLNTEAQLKQQKAEIEKYAALVASDNEIIQIRRQITDAAKAQLENAVLTANDYLLQVDAEDAARQNQILHRLQLRQAQITYAIISGNF